MRNFSICLYLLRVVFMIAAVTITTGCPSDSNGQRSEGERKKHSGKASLLPKYDPSEEWPESCARLKKELSPNPRTNITFQPKPAVVGSQPFEWVLNFPPLSITIPPNNYQIYATVAPNELSIILWSAKLKILISRDPPPEPMSDIFQKSYIGSSKKSPPTEEAKAYTLKLFGKEPTIYDTDIIGYSHTIDDLSCRSDKAFEEIPISIGLILKRTGGPRKPKGFGVYRNPFGLGGIGKSGEWGDGSWDFEVNIPFNDAEMNVTYVARDKDTLQGILKGILVRKVGTIDEKASPRWLQLLGKAVASSSSPKAWRELEGELAGLGSYEKSLKNVRQIIETLNSSK